MILFIENYKRKDQYIIFDIFFFHAGITIQASAVNIFHNKIRKSIRIQKHTHTEVMIIVTVIMPLPY